MKAHAAVAIHLYGDADLVWGAIRDLENSALPEKDKAMLRFVRKVTLESASINAADVAVLHGQGWDDASVFYNRFVSANGVKPVSDEAFHSFGARMAKIGYVRE